jgi:integrase
MQTYLLKRGDKYYLRRRPPADIAEFISTDVITRSLDTSDPKIAAQRCRERCAALDVQFADSDRACRGLLPNQQEAADAAGCTIPELHRRKILAVASGIYDTPYVPNTLKDYVAPETKGLDALIKKWTKERSPTPRSEAAMVRAIDRFKLLVGDCKVKAIRKKDVVKFKDKLLESTTPKNTNYSLTQLNILCAFGVAQDWIDVNPCTGIRVKITKSDPPRLPFSETHLNDIFSSPVYADDFRSRGLAFEAGYWLPLLGLFTGARVNELCQLAPKDVRIDSYRDSDGKEQRCYVLILTNEGEGQTLKNSGSRRRLPIHAEILSRGFAEYVESRKRHKTLFRVRLDKNGSHSAYWSGRWHDYLREVIKITDKRYVFHSFRHTFKDVCRECGIDKGIRDALQGHSEGGAAGGYGGEFYPLRPLVEAMQRYKLHGVKLPA